MGVKQTKIEGNYHPSTPNIECKTQQIVNMNKICYAENGLDPRSPIGCRTPIILETRHNDSQLACIDIPERGPNNEKTLHGLRKRFFKSFPYNLNDPRSPSLKLNRTPLVFEDKLEKSLSLDDTFSDLFVESRLTRALNKAVEPDVAEGDYDDDAVMAPKEKIVEEPSVTPSTLITIQQEFDPRSPSVGVERTPIIFTDDEIDETSEDAMLESILATLSLDMDSSDNSSIVSKKCENEDVCSKKSKLEDLPVNKLLDRVRTGKKKSTQPNRFRTKRRTIRQQIYLDKENCITVTPILRDLQCDRNDHLKEKRTPLSCVRNRNETHVRSRSVESAKSIKTRLELTSFDDALNPTVKYKVSDMCSMRQGSQELLDIN